MILPDTETYSDYTRTTHAVDILAFVEAQEIPSLYFETPYRLSPAPGGEQLYALLCETLHQTRKIGIAYVVIQSRQHLAALMPQGQSLMLTTLRWASETYSRPPLQLPFEELPGSDINEIELMMAMPPMDRCKDHDFDDADFAVPAQSSRRLGGIGKQLMDACSSPNMLVEDMDDLLAEDDDDFNDDYAANTIWRSMHGTSGAALRRQRSQSASHHQRGMRIRRRRP